MKPCPFCGEKEDMKPIEMAHKGDPDNWNWYMRCANCGALGPECGYKQRAEKEWDKRGDRQ